MTLGPSLNKLIRISSEPEVAELDEPVGPLPAGIDLDVLQELLALLREKNGFYALESALELFPANSATDVDLISWNSPTGWRRSYPKIPAAMLFFGQDVVCCQFGVGASGVWKLEPESGELELYADSLEQWAARILEDYSYEVAWKLAHDWQQTHGPIPAGMRLLPKQPFVLGGDFVCENMMAVEREIAMQKLGSLHEQIANLPDGEKVQIHGWLVS